MNHCISLVATVVLAAGVVHAQQQYPEGAPIPRSLTEAESAWLAHNPIAITKAVTPPPTAPM